MQTFYVTFERQGNTKIVIRVEAEDQDEAIIKANEVFINQLYDTYVDTTIPEEDCMIVDEDGYEWIPEDDEELEEEGYIDMEEAYDILSELDLDDTAYNYYKEALDELYYADKESIKNGHGYTSVKDVIADARRTSIKNLILVLI